MNEITQNDLVAVNYREMVFDAGTCWSSKLDAAVAAGAAADAGYL
jgi:hypothetical protein